MRKHIPHRHPFSNCYDHDYNDEQCADDSSDPTTHGCGEAGCFHDVSLVDPEHTSSAGEALIDIPDEPHRIHQCPNCARFRSGGWPLTDVIAYLGHSGSPAMIHTPTRTRARGAESRDRTVCHALPPTVVTAGFFTELGTARPGRDHRLDQPTSVTQFALEICPSIGGTHTRTACRRHASDAAQRPNADPEGLYRYGTT